MGFKRDSELALDWKRWQLRNCEELISIGVPAEIFSHKRRWDHFCGHGFDPESGWGTSRLSAEQKSQLMTFLEREVSPDAARYCLGQPQPEN